MDNHTQVVTVLPERKMINLSAIRNAIVAGEEGIESALVLIPRRYNQLDFSELTLYLRLQNKLKTVNETLLMDVEIQQIDGHECVVGTWDVRGFSSALAGKMKVNFIASDGNKTVFMTENSVYNVAPSIHGLEIGEDIPLESLDQYYALMREQVELAKDEVALADAAATLSRSYARGDTDTRPGEVTDNSKYYMTVARDIKDELELFNKIYDEDGTTTSSARSVTMPGIDSYEQLIGKIVHIRAVAYGSRGSTAPTININGLGAMPIIMDVAGDYGYPLWATPGFIYDACFTPEGVRLEGQSLHHGAYPLGSTDAQYLFRLNIPGIDNYAAVKNVPLFVYATFTPTARYNLYLQIGGLSPLPLYYITPEGRSRYAPAGWLIAGQMFLLICDGSSFTMSATAPIKASTTEYGATKLSSSLESDSEEVAATSSAAKALREAQKVYYFAITNNKFTANIPWVTEYSQLEGIPLFLRAAQIYGDTIEDATLQINNLAELPLYFMVAGQRVRGFPDGWSVLSEPFMVSYDSGSFTASAISPSVATLENYGITKLSSAIDSADETKAATSKAVKLVVDQTAGAIQNINTNLNATMATLEDTVDTVESLSSDTLELRADVDAVELSVTSLAGLVDARGKAYAASLVNGSTLSVTIPGVTAYSDVAGIPLSIYLNNNGARMEYPSFQINGLTPVSLILPGSEADVIGPGWAMPGQPFTVCYSAISQCFNVGGLNMPARVWVRTTLLAASWSSATPPLITVEDSNIWARETIDINCDALATTAQLEAYEKAKIREHSQAEGVLTLKALGEKPAVDIPIEYILRRDSW